MNTDKLYYLNRLINCIDPCKDATVKFKVDERATELTEEIHGKYLKNKVIIPLFNGNELNDADKNNIKGVGNENSALKAKINESLNLKEIPHQEIIRLKISTTNDLRFDKQLFLTYDAGPGPNNFCKDYTLVLTPGSVIDSARKGKTHSSVKSFLLENSKLPLEIITNFDLSSSLRAIEFNIVKGVNQYQFKIETTIPRFGKKTIHFNKNTFNEEGTTYFAGNSTKNKYIYDNYTEGETSKDETSEDEIKFRILAKELGDTLQVAWLKYIIYGKSDKEINRYNTAICTCDTALWLRSVLNEVSCIFTLSNTSTFYPVSGASLSESTDEEKKIKRQRIKNAKDLIKKQLERKVLKKNNMEVIQSLVNFKDYLYFYNRDLDFHGKEIEESAKNLMETILTNVINALNHIQRNMMQNLEDPKVNEMEMNEYRELIAKSYFKSPFRVYKDTRDVEHFSTFTHFINVKGGEKKYGFNANLVYRLLYYGDRTVTEERIVGDDLRNLAPGLNPNANVNMTGGYSSLRERKFNVNEFNNIIEGNIKNPGFLSYYTMMHLPEVIYIIYSISRVYKFPDDLIAKYAELFQSNDTNTKIIESFGKLNVDNKYDYIPQDSPEKLIESDKLFINIYQYLLYFKGESIKRKHNIFNLFYHEIYWMLRNIKKINMHKVEVNTQNYNVNEKKRDENQSLILDVYQELYDAEVYLTILNMRGEKSPVDYIPDIKTYKELNEIGLPLVPSRSNNRNRTQKRARNNNNPYETNNDTSTNRANNNTSTNATKHKGTPLQRGLTPSQIQKQRQTKRRSRIYSQIRNV